MSRKHWSIIVPCLFLLVSLIFVGISVFDLIARIDFYKKIERGTAANKLVGLENKVSYETLFLVDYAKKKEGFVIVDVREKEEFEQGHIVGSSNYRLGDVLDRDEPAEEFMKNISGKKVLLFCHDGERSKIAAAELFGKGIKNIFITESGFDQLRSDDNLKSEIWTGKTSRVLPGDFWDDLQNRGYRAKTIKTEMVVDVSVQSKDISEIAPSSESFHFPLMTLSSGDVESGLIKIGENTITIICDDKVSCFYAKLLAYRVEEQGGKFSGYFYWGRDN